MQELESKIRVLITGILCSGEGDDESRKNSVRNLYIVSTEYPDSFIRCCMEFFCGSGNENVWIASIYDYNE